MAASGLLRERDLRALTAVIEDGLRDDPGPAMPWAVLDQLLQLVPCEDVGFTEYDLRQRYSRSLFKVSSRVGSAASSATSTMSWSLLIRSTGHTVGSSCPTAMWSAAETR